MLLALVLVANAVVAATASARSEGDGVGTVGGESSVIYGGPVDTAIATTRRCGIGIVGDTSILSGLVIAVTARRCVCVSVCSTVGDTSVISGPVATATDTDTATVTVTARRCGIDTVGDASAISGLVVTVTSRRCDVVDTVGGTSVIIITGRVVVYTTASLSIARRRGFDTVDDDASVVSRLIVQLPPILSIARRCVVGTVGDGYVLSSTILGAGRNCVFEPIVDVLFVLSRLQTIAKEFLHE
jgi:hypothetical protein